MMSPWGDVNDMVGVLVSSHHTSITNGVKVTDCSDVTIAMLPAHLVQPLCQKVMGPRSNLGFLNKIAENFYVDLTWNYYSHDNLKSPRIKWAISAPKSSIKIASQHTQ